MNPITFARNLTFLSATLLLSGCEGILSGVYDMPAPATRATSAGQLYVDASDWGKWYYIDFRALADATADNPDFNPSSLWMEQSVPLPEENAESDAAADPDAGLTGIYTYWYDVFGQGIKNYAFRDFRPAAAQAEPAEWSIAVHRNNVRTNGGAVAATEYRSLDDLPVGREWLEKLEYRPDIWNTSDVWVIQDRMLLGLIGNQGITVNTVLSRWLTMDIPPMPPAFSRDGRVFVVRLADGSYAALQLADYMSPEGVKCCLTINYAYPL